MHDYTHGGIRQVARRFKNGEIGSHIELDEAAEILEISNLFAMIAAYVFFERYGSKMDIEALSEAWDRLKA